MNEVHMMGREGSDGVSGQEHRGRWGGGWSDQEIENGGEEGMCGVGQR